MNPDYGFEYGMLYGNWNVGLPPHATPEIRLFFPTPKEILECETLIKLRIIKNCIIGLCSYSVFALVPRSYALST